MVIKTNIKKNHHFVSQFYLENWANSQNQIFTYDGSCYFQNSKKNLGYKKELYRNYDLKPNQITLLENILRKNNCQNVSAYNLVIKEILKTHDILRNAEEIINLLPHDEIKNSLEELSYYKKILSYNQIEEKFCIDESIFAEKLSNIIKGNKKLTLFDYDVLTHFIVFQFMKTPKALESFQLNEKTKQSHNFTENEWNTFILYFIICIIEKVQSYILVNLYKINIYYNNTPINFITSDHPCFNQKIAEDDQFHIQLPISPRVMIELIQNNDDDKTNLLKYYNANKEHTKEVLLDNRLINFPEINQQEIKSLNKKIFKKKQRFIYAHCENISTYRKFRVL